MLLCKISYTVKSCVLYLVWLLFGDSIPICLFSKKKLFCDLFQDQLLLFFFGGGGEVYS